jgi:hypothetical protein
LYRDQEDIYMDNMCSINPNHHIKRNDALHLNINDINVNEWGQFVNIEAYK